MKIVAIVGGIAMVLNLVCLAPTAIAEQGNNEEFAKRKAEMLQDADLRISKINEFKSCVSSASTPDAMKPCREKMKQFHESHRAEVVERHKTRLDERIKNLEAKRAELNQPKK